MIMVANYLNFLSIFPQLIERSAIFYYLVLLLDQYYLYGKFKRKWKQPNFCIKISIMKQLLINLTFSSCHSTICQSNLNTSFLVTYLRRCNGLTISSISCYYNFWQNWQMIATIKSFVQIPTVAPAMHCHRR